MFHPSSEISPGARRPRCLPIAVAALASLLLLGFGPATPALAGGLILNEYNAVASDQWLNGGDEFADADGGLAGDATFGRILANGGDWFELVVTQDGLDLRGWRLVVMENGAVMDTLVLSQHSIWTTLQAGTIITVSEEFADDVSYDPGAGDWNINVQAVNGGSGTYISAISFPVSNDNWQIEIRDSTETVQFGPAGEGVSPPSGVNGSEIWRLEENPSGFITESSLCYEDADTRSTWGLPNQWSAGTKTQDFAPLRNGTAPTTQCDASDLTPLAYDPERLLDVEVTMAPADYEALRRQDRNLLDTFGGRCGDAPPPNPFTFFHADVTVDGTTLTDVGIRKKGFMGSASRHKPSFKIDFGEFGGKQSVYSLERMTLNNGRQDPTLLDQCLGYALFRAAGLVASRCNFAHVKMNGVSLGIYMNVESIKDPFLVRNYGNATGNLYEGTMADFRENWIGLIEWKNNEDGSDLQAVADALLIADDAEFLGALGAVVDIDKFITYWALSGLIGDWDGYPGNANNFWLYNNPNTGLLEFIPWSLDDIFGRDNPFMNLLDPSEARTVFDNAALSNRLWRIPSIRNAYAAEIDELITTVWDEAALLAEIDRMEALITPVAGPLPGVSDTEAWISGRAARVAADFAEGPPELASVLPEKMCLEVRGHVSGDFSSPFFSALPQGLPADTTLTEVDFELDGSTSLIPLAAGFGYDPVFFNMLTLRPLGLTSYPYGLAFNIVLEEEDIVADPEIEIAVSDSITSALMSFHATTGAAVMVGMMVNSTLAFDEADLTPGGMVSGSFGSDLALWVPHPESEPEPVPSVSPLGMALLGGLVFAIAVGGLAVQRRRGAR